MGTALLVREELPASEGGAVQECAVAPESVLIRLHVWRHRALGSEESAVREKGVTRVVICARGVLAQLLAPASRFIHVHTFLRQRRDYSRVGVQRARACSLSCLSAPSGERRDQCSSA